MGALGCSECHKREGNNTRMRPTHERSRLCGCVCMFCFHSLCNACFGFSPINDSISWRFVGFERLDLVSSPCFDGFACFVLHVRNAGPSRRRVEQANLLCGLCFAISPEPNCEPQPHISETYQSIGRAEPGQWIRTGVFGCLESSK